MPGESVEGKAGVVVAKVPWPAGGSVCAAPLFKLWISVFFYFFFLVLFCDCLWKTVEYCCARSTRAVVVQEIRCIKF